MPAIPLPFVVSGILVLFVLRLMTRRGRDLWFLIFVGACALQTTLVGMRWSLGLGEVRFIQPVLAAFLPLFALAAFMSLRSGVVSRWHLLWPAAVIVCWWALPAAIDWLLIVEFTAYAIAILALPLPDEAMTHVRIGDEWAVPYARIGTAALLLLSALSDLIVSVALADGDHAAAPPVIAAILSVILVGLAGGLLGWAVGVTPEETDAPLPGVPEEAPPATEEEQAILVAVEAALAQGLYRDHDLTLERLARRTAIPARKISRAVNRLREGSVTDMVNGYRAREAMRLLRESDLPITQIMLDCGFQTKSNFNRAFKAIAGQTPSAYRLSGN
ncbi:Carnitine catabolism transcriptional activator [Marinibacterium anthonyi]|nr:Carnitine catabolism transcriptional activator [Marinibacterium anthonyi]